MIKLLNYQKEGKGRMKTFKWRRHSNLASMLIQNKQLMKSFNIQLVNLNGRHEKTRRNQCVVYSSTKIGRICLQLMMN